ncbi:hypothetical protein [Streptomyces spiralis]
MAKLMAFTELRTEPFSKSPNNGGGVGEVQQGDVDVAVERV